MDSGCGRETDSCGQRRSQYSIAQWGLCIVCVFVIAAILAISAYYPLPLPYATVPIEPGVIPLLGLWIPGPILVAAVIVSMLWGVGGGVSILAYTHGLDILHGPASGFIWGLGVESLVWLFRLRGQGGELIQVVGSVVIYSATGIVGIWLHLHMGLLGALSFGGLYYFPIWVALALAGWTATQLLRRGARFLAEHSG